MENAFGLDVWSAPTDPRSRKGHLAFGATFEVSTSALEAAIEADSQWVDVGTSAFAVRIGLLDSGVSLDHDDAGNVTSSWAGRLWVQRCCRGDGSPHLILVEQRSKQRPELVDHRASAASSGANVPWYCAKETDKFDVCKCQCRYVLAHGVVLAGEKNRAVQKFKTVL